MKKTFLVCTITIISVLCVLAGISYASDSRQGIEDKPFLIREGILCLHQDTVVFDQNGKKVRIVLSEPVIIAMAERPEKWGYFQFPSISRADDGTLLVCWQMNDDSYETLGKDSGRKDNNRRISKDGGFTWTYPDKEYNIPIGFYQFPLKNGDKLQVETPASVNIKDYDGFPKEDCKVDFYTFFSESSLPDKFKGCYIAYWNSRGQKFNYIHSNLIDPGLYKYAVAGYFPFIWWGDIKDLGNGSYVAGVNAGFYCDEKGSVLPSGISFYKTDDGCKNWRLLSVIPYEPDDKLDPYGKKRKVDGFSEPAFEILRDSTYLCVIRSSDGHQSPMYRAFSSDRGKSWTKAEPFTPNGVFPSLMLMGNGVLVLASGRPGIQLRFSLDGKGVDWTEPLEMMPFMKDDSTYEALGTCGYAQLLSIDDNSFYILYSDFNEKNSQGELRKTIKIRKVTVTMEY